MRGCDRQRRRAGVTDRGREGVTDRGREGVRDGGREGVSGSWSPEADGAVRMEMNVLSFITAVMRLVVSGGSAGSR